MGDWLGTGTIATFDKKFRSFEKAREFVQKIGIKSQTEWEKYLKSGKRPKDIPGGPRSTYKKEWKGWGHFLGTGTIANRLIVYAPFKEAREFAQSLELKNLFEWREYVVKNKKFIQEKGIPADPRVYKKEYKGSGDWLGTGSLSPSETAKRRIPWKEAKLLYQQLAKQYGIKTMTDWKKIAKKIKLPKNLPPDPSQVYTEEKIRKSLRKK